jgi:hypothetical protein
MPGSEKYEVVVLYHCETDKAVCVSKDNEEEQLWLPKSQIEYEQKPNGTPKVDNKGLLNVEVPLWLLQKHEFAGF